MTNGEKQMKKKYTTPVIRDNHLTNNAELKGVIPALALVGGLVAGGAAVATVKAMMGDYIPRENKSLNPISYCY